jgi:predicted nucleotidyltransferase
MEYHRSTSWDTARLKRAILHRRARNEAQRLVTLEQAKRWLAAEGKRYGIDQAYLFGSVIRPYRFTEKSDLDIAVETIQPDTFFDALAHLSEAVGRDVDLVDLSKCHFAERIRQRGVQWKKPI